MVWDGKSISLIANHLPQDITRREIEEFFSEENPVKKCHLVRDRHDVFRGMAYIIYHDVEAAAQAVKRFNNCTLNGKVLRVKLSRQRERKKAGREQKVQKVEDEVKEEEEEADEKGISKKDYDFRGLRSKKKGRVIIRNLSFKADEKIVEDHFSKYGKIMEVSILRKKGGKMVGCAFVQFDTRADAIKAILGCNMKPLLGRPISVDLAVPKEKYKLSEVKAETPDDEATEVTIKEEVVSSDEEDNKEEIEIKKEKLDSDDEDGDSSLDESIETDSKSEDDEKPTPTKTKQPPTKGPSKDVVEERTLFIKNLSFDATDEEIAEVLRKYGELKYVLLCIDKLTEHPRGTAFAQFMESEAANACLAAEADPSTKTEFILHGRQMHIMKAVSREYLEKGKDHKGQQKIKTDKRNLFLAREGFVRPGTQAAVGLSMADLALRTSREQVKRRMLQNLNIFVSTTRLCVHNLPEMLKDKQLEGIFRKHAPAGAEITECRIMRNLKDIDENNEPRSRGYGFITFMDHEHALAALRKINNNPNIFTNAQRPVVEFSLENRSVLQARQKRMEKSREKNPLWKKGRAAKANDTKKGNKTSVSLRKPEKGSEETKEEIEPAFVGSKSDPSKKALPINYGPKIRDRDKHGAGKGKISRKQFRKEQRDRALGRKRKRPQNEELGSSPAKAHKEEEMGGQGEKKRRGNRKKVSKQMISEMREEKAFTAMVEKYKKKMASVNSAPSHNRWYED